MIARWTGVNFPGGASYAGYAMAATSFLALAYTFDHAAHIRVSLFVSKAGRGRRAVELWCYTIAALATLFFAWHAIQANLTSVRFNDISQGRDATPLWIPQLFMSVGTVILAVAVLDHLFRLVLSDHRGVDPGDAEERWSTAWLASPKARIALVGGFLLTVYVAVALMTGFDRDATFLKIGVFLFVLFFLLGSGVWVGLALMGVAYMGMVGFTTRNPGSAMVITVWTGRAAGR